MLEAAEDKSTTDGLTAFLWFKPLPMLARWEAAFFMEFRMAQRTLEFDTPAKLSRKSDPITSQQSAAETEKKLGKLKAGCLAVMKAATKPMTAREIAVQAAKEFGGFDSSYRARPSELVTDGLAVEAGERACEVTGKSAMTFRVKEQP